MADTNKTQDQNKDEEKPKQDGNIRGIDYIKSEIEKHHASKEEESSIDKSARRTMFASWAMVILAAVSIYVNWKTLRVLNNQYETMKGQLEIASKQIFEMQSEQRIDQRAWMASSGVKPHWNGDDPDDFEISIINTGKTPALGCVVVTGTCEFLKDVNNFFDHPRIANPESQAYGMISPGNNVRSGAGPIFPDVIKRVRDGSNGGNFYVCGWIAYSDIYKVKHRTEFCYGASPKSNFSIFSMQGKHNRTIDINK